MPNEFDLPSIEVLTHQIKRLGDEFNLRTKRYKVEPQTDVVRKASDRLRVLIERVNPIASCVTDRVTARDVFPALVNLLRQPLNESPVNEEQCEKATLFLLGALIHRYLRLCKSYDDTSSAVSTASKWSFGLFGRALSLVTTKGSDPKDCRLFCAVRTALNLPEITSPGYRAEDLVILDPMTVTMCLKSFKSNMLMKTDTKEHRYLEYPHYADNLKFITELDCLIMEREGASKHLFKESAVVSFIQQSSSRLADYRSEFATGVIATIQAVIGAFKDTCAKPSQVPSSSLLEEKIDEHATSAAAGAELKALLKTKFITAGWGEMENWEPLTGAIEKISMVRTRLILVGLCSLGLGLIRAHERSSLPLCIYNILGISDPNILTLENRFDAIKALTDCVESNPTILQGVDMSCLGHYSFQEAVVLESDTLRLALQKTEAGCSEPQRVALC